MASFHFLSVALVLQIHRRVVDEFGGDVGLRDRGLLESAVAMAQASFAGKYLHTSLAEMAAAYHYHLCANHPFIDGNKRVAVASAEIFIMANGFVLGASNDELVEITMGIAQGVVAKEDVIAFYAKHVAAES